MGLMKLVKNAISSEWKKTFNDNVDYLNGLETRVDQRNQATNKRIDNLVLNAGGDSPNEVVDARVNSEGAIFETLRERLAAGELLTKEELALVNQLIKNQSDAITQLNSTIQELYGGSGGSISLFVSAELGNDTTADGTEEKPFKTIQAAINSLPLLSTSEFFIYVEPGVYLEDVVISNITSGQLEIVGTNLSVVDASAGDTGVFVRSVAFIDCGMYCAVRGFTQTDAANSPKRFIYFTGVMYGVVDKCRAVQNTKNIDGYTAFGWERCVSGNIYGSHASNQYYAIKGAFGTGVRISNAVSGTENNIVYRSEGSTIYRSTGASISGTTMESKSYGGQVFEG
ncbi:hypothetical protein [Enterococcus diestrammenae]|uniref:Uncharacterized protein n=1 Tax=Enterococcus diestrammenae TaxID=1155073 RepID=A0ABV0F598_9ENTE|nr:hypothetical protein [Enterococcus diestrammenae]KAF1297638.1 hypothetical protein BAU18_06815 [Enterococcus diestrammenae]